MGTREDYAGGDDEHEQVGGWDTKNDDDSVKLKLNETTFSKKVREDSGSTLLDETYVSRKL